VTQIVLLADTIHFDSSKGNWSPTVGNLRKRDILRDLLADVGRLNTA
jgi:hypothetical protein